MEEIKVSVIIPVYNTEKYLRECLNSVINQTLHEIEIICVNDGSTDNSANILQEYCEKDHRIIVLSQENKGAGAARNKGLEAATGKYLAFLDSDDFFVLDAFEKCYVAAEEKNADIVVYNINCYDSVSKEFHVGLYQLNQNRLPNEDVFSYIDMPNNIFDTLGTLVWNKFLKRSFIHEHTINFQELQRTNDLYFSFCALISASRITVLYESLIYYRVGMNDNSQATNHKSPLDFYKAIAAFRQKMIELNLYNAIEMWYTNFVVGSCIYNLQSQKFAESFELIYDTIKNEIFQQFGIFEKPKEYYWVLYYEKVKSIEHNSAVQYLINQQEKNLLAERDNLFVERNDLLIERDNLFVERNDLLAERDNLLVRLSKQKKKVKNIRKSFSYRIGRMITWLPRKVRGMF
jgi:glycosyltransferase involved in cell wall biosynthesis